MMKAVKCIVSLWAAMFALSSAGAWAQNVSFIGSGGVGTTTYVSSANPLPVTGSFTSPTSTPVAGAAVAVATGGSAVTAINANAKGCIIVNPLTATDEGIGAVEPLYVNPVTTATTAGNGTTAALAPGQSWVCIPSSTAPVTINATTSGHKATVIAW